MYAERISNFEHFSTEIAFIARGIMLRFNMSPQIGRVFIREAANLAMIKAGPISVVVFYFAPFCKKILHFMRTTFVMSPSWAVNFKNSATILTRIAGRIMFGFYMAPHVGGHIGYKTAFFTSMRSTISVSYVICLDPGKLIIYRTYFSDPGHVNNIWNIQIKFVDIAWWILILDPSGFY